MSAYLTFEQKDPLSDNIRALIEFCSERNKKLVFGCDANAHHTVWGGIYSTICGDELLEDILLYNL